VKERQKSLQKIETISADDEGTIGVSGACSSGEILNL
jgi:hypothetical protein